MYKVIQWATGAMGRASLRRIIEHPDLDLVGLYVYGDKQGRDAGEIARRPETGVIATNRIEDILATDADIVMHMPRLTEPYDAMNSDVARLLASGKNVISIAGFHWPDFQGAAYAEPLRAACLAGQSSLAGLGLNPGTLVERITLAATAMSTRLDHIRVSEAVDASHMASPDFVFNIMGFGSDPAVVDLRQGKLAQLYGALFGEVFANVAAALGTTIVERVNDHQITVTPHDLTIAAGIIPKGRVAATEWRWVAVFGNGVKMTLSILWTANPAMHPRCDHGHWLIELDGRPNIKLTMDITDEDPNGPPSRGLVDATVAVALNAIPDICAAAPGFFALPPPPTYRDRFSRS